ncbi:hypothetical protein [Dichotomicrobium thermohalophilum]|uniref:Lipoprotein n=1 Tax=Dichotomicrobium thermohalophilum TaxID=933063 RepID=A0A397Q5L4_9HYPH|nr:hypothetical protein [Dichotomicrobium thermohalophilum]RIA56392.1 hypothetical protein BXY53_1498 [Dichotomicrobium thermohalophilum]
MHNKDIGIGSRRVRTREATDVATARHALRLAVIVAGTLFLSGCGISQITSGLGSDVFGSSEEEPENADWTATITEEGMLEAARSDTSGRIDASGPASGCPRFKIWPADRHITVYEPGRVGERLAMRHRGSITKVARECQINGPQVSVKYGFAGRVLMGPRGQDGTVELPVNLYLTRGDGSKIRTERMMVEVELRRENPVDYFSVVRTISFEAEPGTSPSSYKLFVAFDREIPGAS